MSPRRLPWLPGWSEHGIPGCLAAHNALSSTAPDPGVIGEWLPKQVLRKRQLGPQGTLDLSLGGAQGHAPVTPRAISSGRTASQEPASGPS